MRIVAGRWRGRTIAAPRGKSVRPTADRVREAWMSIVQRDLADARVLDLFAGSGALGLEALSRGARRADFVEIDGASLATLRANIATLRAESAAMVHRGDALRFIDGVSAGGYNVAFADPPYGSDLAELLAIRWLAVPFATVLGIEHAATRTLPLGVDTRRYGDTAVTFYRAAT